MIFSHTAGFLFSYEPDHVSKITPVMLVCKKHLKEIVVVV